MTVGADETDQYHNALQLFTQINLLREDVQDYKSNLFSRYAAKELSRWDNYTADEQFIWEDALSHAARHIANIEGSCGVDGGDVYGTLLQDVLLRYYAFDYEDLQVLKINS